MHTFFKGDCIYNNKELNNCLYSNFSKETMNTYIGCHNYNCIFCTFSNGIRPVKKFLDILKMQKKNLSNTLGAIKLKLYFCIFSNGFSLAKKFLLILNVWEKSEAIR